MKCPDCGRPMKATIDIMCNHGDYSEPEITGVHFICEFGWYKQPKELQCSNQRMTEAEELRDKNDLECFIAQHFQNHLTK